ncbi:site-specific integrase [Bacillus sp. ISL-39]|uniref:tyrosine-type recombinase/integrase n=1 Tax=Bacillus sp. ISL-39 TaxID=2819124 RepID=UPI001BE81908|nr:site-specific integrase [Bacillus sp. ISL-39]MBT2636590.1 site-specific integrase [Bacillus sp. ISL-39]
MIIKDRQTKIGTLYERFDSEGKLIKQVGTLGFIKESTIKKHKYFMLFDLRGKLIYEANYYLNSILENASYKNRERAFNALKLFYSFLELFHINNHSEGLNKENADRLISFLEGGFKDGISLKLDLKTTRNKDTIASYLGIYIDFYEAMFIVKDIEILKRILSKKRNFQKRKLKNNLSPTLVRQNTPKYIKENEYKIIMEIVEISYSLRDRIIIDLMYHYGLRLGEVLGLTLEDIEPINNEKSKLIIRNRLSDAPWQKAKGVITPTSKEDYYSQNMTAYGYGFQTVIIDNELAELMEEYIDETRNPRILIHSPMKKENLKSKSTADKISAIPLVNNENQYIFLSHQNYFPLTQGGWNYVLRGIFDKAGIQIDKVSKTTNLSHRFRHAFAMKKVKDGILIIQLAELMRHRNINSCKAYYNPDEEDQIELQELYTKNSKEKYNFE